MPEFEIFTGEDDEEASLHLGRIVPIYEAVQKLNTRLIRTLTHRVIQAAGSIVRRPIAAFNPREAEAARTGRPAVPIGTLSSRRNRTCASGMSFARRGMSA